NHKNSELLLSDRNWTCQECGKILDRDVNAAINIKNEGCRKLGIA
ncbi:MAG: transposase, partial [Dethiobacter sp.]|nr:transposase [Dethiobacter sp.]